MQTPIKSLKWGDNVGEKEILELVKNSAAGVGRQSILQPTVSSTGETYEEYKDYSKSSGMIAVSSLPTLEDRQSQGRDPFDPSGMKVTRPQAEESKKTNPPQVVGISGMPSLDPMADEHEKLFRIKNMGSPSARVFKVAQGSMAEIGSDLIVPVRIAGRRPYNTAPLIPPPSSTVTEQL
jgi:hypothetical protein